jgi:hypothetical protein
MEMQVIKDVYTTSTGAEKVNAQIKISNALEDYHVEEYSIEEIMFDEHNRPYVQSPQGRIMLSRKTPYPYEVKN